jgi:phage tail-like protein
MAAHGILPGDRIDPYKNFKFRVFFEGISDPVAGVSKVSGLKRSTELVEHRAGGDPSTSLKGPGRNKFEAVTIERGCTLSVDFEQWANKVWQLNSGTEVSLKDFRRNLMIAVYNEAGQLVLRYKLYRCWVSEYQAVSDLDANANAILIEHIKIETEGWERDHEVTVDQEPTFTVPPGP